MLAKYRLMAAALRRGRFSYEELSQETGIPYQTVATTFGRHWNDVVIEVPALDRDRRERGGQRKFFEVGQAFVKRIEAELRLVAAAIHITEGTDSAEERGTPESPRAGAGLAASISEDLTEAIESLEST